MPPYDNRNIDELRRAVDALDEMLRQERIRSEAFRHRLNQQEAQIRELQRTTRGILDSRIWKTLVRMGGQLLWFSEQKQSLRTRFLVGRSKMAGAASSELVQLCNDGPTTRAGRLTGKVRVHGWATAPSGIEAVRVQIGNGPMIPATLGYPRSDVQKLFPSHKGAAESGYRATVDLSELAPGAHALKVQAVSKQGAITESALSIQVGNTIEQRTPAQVRLLLDSMRHKPLISVLTPIYNTPERWLRRAIESVLDQQYPNWELCLADDRSTDPHIRSVLEEYKARDPRIKVAYRDTNGHIAEATNTALELATGEFVALLDHDDEIAPDALLEVAIALNQNPSLDFIYSDEDKIDEEGFCTDPFYKPDWSPDYFLTCMYTCHLGVYRTSLVREIGQFRPEVNGAQDYDLALRLVTQTERIHHIPKVLYHWRTLETSTASGAEAKDYAYPAAQRAIENHLQLAGTPGTVLPGPRA
ncbi:MAG TPA: glycosyltransferase, partial [Bryobacteraceae bacterium]|nr:glycosyltransferase [Bryobacteraceae bacterium]